MTDSPILAAALAYAARGWRIFPCDPHPEAPRSKAPLVVMDKGPDGKKIPLSGWPAKASTDEAQIRAWWKRWPDALIGMAPGWADAFVIDLDPKGESVEAVAARLEGALGEPLPPGARTRTKSGGLHLWFRRPPGLIWGNTTPGLHNIDIRCDNGYVILPPSRLRDGKEYHWEGSPYEGDAPPLPARLIEMIQARERGARTPVENAAPRTRTGGPARSLATHDAGEEARRRYARAALDRIAQDAAMAGEGRRGTELYAAACQLGRFVAAGALSEREAIAALQDAADGSGLSAKDGAARVAREIERGLETGRGDAAEVKARLDEIGREAVEKAARRQGRQPHPPAEAYEAEMASRPAPPSGPAAPPDDGDPRPWDAGEGEGGAPSEVDRTGIDPDDIIFCAALDQSDTDNGQRLIRHFGKDLAVLQRSGARNSDFLAWVGTHWDIETGNDVAFRIAQRVGGLIGLEADHMAATWHEAQAMRAAEDTQDERARLAALKERTDEQKARLNLLDRISEDGEIAADALKKRQIARRKFGVSSKNKTRLDAMLACAAPHLTRSPALFNADALRAATMTHTLTFRRVRDDDCPDPDAVRHIGAVEAVEGHERAHMITHVIASNYDPGAACPRWDAFMERFLPVEPVRRFVEVYSGLGLLGLTIQKMVFHYGEGANGKSVFMQTLYNVLGALASNLSPDSITGTNQRQGAQASPDLARLFGKRYLRVGELPEGVALQEELVKRLTGGEEIPVRNLFQGVFDFKPVFKAHMSGNGYPRIDGTNHGIWRRMAVVHWPTILAEAEQRNFDDVIDDFRPEYPGILNWLIRGALIYLGEGLVVPDEVKAATQEYRDEMDPVGAFIRDCVDVVEGCTVTARDFYLAYTSWCSANAVVAIKETRFGKTMRARFTRKDDRIRLYLNIRLHDVPQTDAPQPPFPGFRDD